VLLSLVLHSGEEKKSSALSASKGEECTGKEKSTGSEVTGEVCQDECDAACETATNSHSWPASCARLLLILTGLLLLLLLLCRGSAEEEACWAHHGGRVAALCLGGLGVGCSSDDEQRRLGKAEHCGRVAMWCCRVCQKEMVRWSSAGCARGWRGRREEGGAWRSERWGRQQGARHAPPL
jgi:hypothetical protein